MTNKDLNKLCLSIFYLFLLYLYNLLQKLFNLKNRCANIGGDSDTVAAILGQIVGAYNGIDSELMKLYETVCVWD